MPLNTEVPQWLVQQDQWIKGIGSRGVSELFSGMQAAQDIKLNQQKQDLNLLSMQQQQLQLANNRLQMGNILEDQKAMADWIAQGRDPDSEPAWKSTAYQQNSWMRDQHQTALDIQKQAVENRLATAQANEDLKAQALSLQKQNAELNMQVKQQQLDIAARTVAVRENALGEKTDTDQQKIDLLKQGLLLKQDKAKQDLAGPQTLDLGNGFTMAWMPGGKTLHVIKPDGSKEEWKPGTMLQLAKSLDEQGDPRAQKITDFLAGKAMDQMSKPSVQSGPLPLPKSKTELKNGQAYTTPQGVYIWNGEKLILQK